MHDVVQSTNGRLRRKFPEISVEIPHPTATDQDFIQVLAESLQEMDTVDLPEMKPIKSLKKKVIHDKYEATMPIHVFDALFGFLCAHGTATARAGIVKHTRDVALSNEIDPDTIRRSPLWLLFKVTLQQVLCSHDDPNDHSLYKNFILFFLALILDAACDRDRAINDETLFFMSRKIAYRVVKLQDSNTSGPCMESVASAVKRADAILQSRWKVAIQSDQARKIKPMPPFDSDISKCYVKCPAVQEFLYKANQSDAYKTPAVADPKSSIIVWPKEHLPNLDRLDNEASSTSVFNLIIFEHWVEDYLPDYIDRHKGHGSTCTDLEKVATAYKKRATKAYKGIPDHLSIMYLTLLELWIACDRSAVFRTPLLLEYQPFGIQDIDWGTHLLLHTQAERNRLSRAEAYIENRSTDRPSMISNYATPDCFAARFAQTSQVHCALMAEIKQDTENEKQKKREELKRLKLKQQEYFTAHDNSSCSPTLCRMPTGALPCTRCNQLNIARDMTITPYKEPLPNNDAAFTVVFELRVPGHIFTWREFCLAFLVDIVGHQNLANKSAYYTYLQSYTRLAPYFRASGSDKNTRIYAASKAENQDMKPIPVTQDTEFSDICQRTSMRWRLFDSKDTKYIESFQETEKLREECTMRLDEADHVLQQFLYQPVKESDQQRKKQPDDSGSDCDESMDDPKDKSPNKSPDNSAEESDDPDNPDDPDDSDSSDEPADKTPNQNHLICKRDLTRSTALIKHIEELGSLRFGEKVIWPKVLRELQGTSINWTAPEASIFISQVALEASYKTSGDNLSRERHTQLNDETFSLKVLHELARHLKLYKENFSEHIGLAVISTIAIKILVESPPSCHPVALDVLHETRRTCFDMLKSIRDTSDSTAHMARVKLNVALVCVYTFNVANTFLKPLLVESETAEKYVFCSIVIQEGNSKITSQFQKSLYAPWQRLAATASRILVGQVRSKQLAGIANGIYFSLGLRVHFTPDQEIFSHLSGSWIRTFTKPVGAAAVQTIHFNCLTAEVLVNGKAPSFLPSAFLTNPDFRALFGDVCPAVLPSNHPRYQYEFRCSVKDARIQIGLEEAHDKDTTQFGSHDLHVRAQRGVKTSILVPRRIIAGESFPFPSELLTKYFHWHDLGETPYQIDFRPFSSPWDAVSTLWYLCPQDENWVLSTRQAEEIMVPKTCEYHSSFSDILKYFRTDNDLTVTMNEKSKTLRAHLGSLALEFFVKHGSSTIQSVQYENMYIQTDHQIKTLIGLQSKLLLADCGNSNRRVLIVPDGKVHYEKQGQEAGTQLTIEIDKDTTVQQYVIDEILCQLKGNGTWRSKVYLAYLHALTTQCLPDPFTSNTGQETALDILRSAAVMSFESLDPTDFELLQKINELAPERDRTPMRQSGWMAPTLTWQMNLPVSSHHDGFRNAVENILNRAAEMHVFTSSTPFERKTEPRQSRLSREADATRFACFRTEGYGAESHTTGGDSWYWFRKSEVKGNGGNRRSKNKNDDHMQFGESSGFNQAFLASFGLKEKRRFQGPVPSSQDISQFLSKRNVMKAATQHLNAETFRYSGDWANEEKTALQVDFCSIHRALTAKNNSLSPYRIRLWLSTVASGMDHNVFKCIIPVICAIIVTESDTSIPHVTSTYLHMGSERSAPQIKEILDAAKMPFRGDSKHLSEFKVEEERKSFNQNQIQAISQLAERLAGHGELDFAEYRNYLDVATATNAVRELFHKWDVNRRWNDYFTQLSNAVLTMRIAIAQTPALRYTLPPVTSTHRLGYITMTTVVKQPIKVFGDGDQWRSKYIQYLSSAVRAQRYDLQPSLSSLTSALEESFTKPHENDYVKRLNDSVEALNSCTFMRCTKFDQVSFQKVAKEYEAEIEKRLRARMDELEKGSVAMFDSSCISSIIQHSGAMPRVSLKMLLRQLSFGLRRKLSKEWLDCLQQVAALCRDRQHMTRILRSIHIEDALLKDLQTIHRYALDTSSFPDAVLLEIEQDLCLRSNQVEIAQKMRKPPKNTNAVMQLNMGEGKSSVIIPILSASLAQGKKLIRVFVGKHQMKQMVDTMTAALGGLLNRRIFYMPFNREQKLNPSDIKRLNRTLHQCKDLGGILLLQPEHHLSLKLSACLNEDTAQTVKLVEILKFFQNDSRDIIDEIDENLSPTYELVYTIGSQVAIDFAPDRWVLVQGLLDLYQSLNDPKDPKNLRKNIAKVQFLRGRGPDAYPEIRFLTPEMACTSIETVAKRLRYKTITGLPIAGYPAAVKKAVYQFISKPKPKDEWIKAIQELNQPTQSAIALVRGFIAGDLLQVAFTRKRWRVDFGCDFKRTPATRLAVPFTAKDVPKPRSEFSNADVVIIFTQLSYYYNGFRKEDARELIELMRRADDGHSVYETWFTQTSKMSPELRRLNSVNLEDKKQFEEKFYKNIQFCKKAIDHFLGYIVFPKELRAYRQHIAASGWDLGEKKPNPTTGFSGTTDLCAVLPMDMILRQVPSQEHTNALVLNHVLDPQNTVVSLHRKLKTTTTDSARMVKEIIANGAIRVILDVGAQIITLTNEQIARHWLIERKDDPSIEAVVFFNAAGVLSVIDRNRRTMPLKTSVFEKRLEACVVFLDEAHTRGTDLRLPRDYRAAVTLGAGLTKDRLMQGKNFCLVIACVLPEAVELTWWIACMRMRNLGHGQTLTFYVSFDIESDIRQRLQLGEDEPITTANIIHWSITQTTNGLTRLMPYWAKQGRRHEEQSKTWDMIFNWKSPPASKFEGIQERFVRAGVNSV